MREIYSNRISDMTSHEKNLRSDATSGYQGKVGECSFYGSNLVGTHVLINTNGFCLKTSSVTWHGCVVLLPSASAAYPSS